MLELSPPVREGTRGLRAPGSLLLHGERELQRLLLPALYDLLPELALVLHALELRLDVLLRDLQEAQHTVVRLLCDHVEDVSEPLRAALPPGLVHAEGHVFSTFLPAKQLHVSLTLVQAFRIVEARAWEDPDHLGKLDNTLRQGGRAMLEVLEGLLVHLGVKHIVD